MAACPPFIKGAARLGVAALIIVLAIAPDVASAGSNNRFQSNRNGNGNGGNSSMPYNVDQDPCMSGGRHRQGQNCPNDAFSFPRGNGRGSHHPGSSAFGLQFNSGDD